MLFAASNVEAIKLSAITTVDQLADADATLLLQLLLRSQTPRLHQLLELLKEASRMPLRSLKRRWKPRKIRKMLSRLLRKLRRIKKNNKIRRRRRLRMKRLSKLPRKLETKPKRPSRTKARKMK